MAEEKQQENSDRRIVGRPFPPGTSGNPNGHPKGKTNFKSRFKKLVELYSQYKTPQSITDALKKNFPEFPADITFEEAEALRVHFAALAGEDWAYSRMLGKPEQSMDITTKGKELGNTNRTEAELQRDLDDLRRRRKNLRGGRAEADLPA
jgi:hypothetical protein